MWFGIHIKRKKNCPNCELTFLDFAQNWLFRRQTLHRPANSRPTLSVKPGSFINLLYEI